MSVTDMDAIMFETDLQKKIAEIRQHKSAASLMKLMQQYDWSEGFEIPLAVITHSCCDLGLALYLFWQSDEARQYYKGESDTDDEYQLAFCKTLVDGLLKGRYKEGSNKFDTGFYGEHLFPEGSAVHELRALKTQRAQKLYADALLQPVL